MKRKIFLAAVVILLAGIWLRPAIYIEAPDKIDLNIGERFCADDYVSIRGGDVYEYWDNVNTNREGSYTLTVKVKSKWGQTKEKTVTVIVEK